VKKSKSNRKHSHRRSFTQEFKQEAVNLTTEPNQSISKVAEDLGVSVSAVRNWVIQEDAGYANGGSGVLTNIERQELLALKKENKLLRMERDILKKAAAFFAKEQM
jgi:transposase-like protein